MLTEKQESIFEYIVRCIDATGFPPTRQEIACREGLKSKSTVQGHLKAIAAKGAIELDRKGRIRILKRDFPNDPASPHG